MRTYPTPANEFLRLETLKEYNILDSLSEEEYDNIARIAAAICDVPVSLITILDSDRQWFKAHIGTEVSETPREFSFCNYTIMEPDKFLMIPDLRVDPRFAENALVTGDEKIVFYAGAALVMPDGNALGSLCVIDRKPRQLTTEQMAALKGLALTITSKLELRKKVEELDASRNELRRANKNLRSFAEVVSHDMKTPLASIAMLTKSLRNAHGKSFTGNEGEYLDLIDISTDHLLGFIDDVLARSTEINADVREGNSADSQTVVNNVVQLLGTQADIEITVEGTFPHLAVNKTALQRIFQNLVTNAIKYNDKDVADIRISSKVDGAVCVFEVEDNGAGIARENLDKIFARGATLDQTDRFGNKGTGLGLAAIKEIIEDAEGSIQVRSVKKAGSIFTVILPVALPIVKHTPGMPTPTSEA